MELDPVLLSRIQFAFVVSFHAIFPVFTIGLASYVAVLHGLFYKTGNPAWDRLAAFWVKVFAVVFGIGFGGRTPLTTAIRGEYFGRASFGKILGMSTVPMNILLLIASPMAGYMRDQLGDYDLAFRTLAVLTFVGAILFLLAKRPRLPATATQARMV